MNYDEMIAQEKAEGFDRSVAEDVIDRYFETKIGGVMPIFESNEPGVIAFERLSWVDGDKVSFDHLASLLKEATGTEVVCVASCDWSFDDRADEEATFFAFDIPSLDTEYRNDPRNELDSGADIADYTAPTV